MVADASSSPFFQHRFALPAAEAGRAACPGGPTVACYSLSGRAPRLTSALLLAERIHAALVQLSDGSSVFTGCDSSGRPLKGNAHAYVLSEPDPKGGGNGRISHVTVYAPAGFGPVERKALESLREIHGFGVYLSQLGLGWPADFSGRDGGDRSSILAQARTWVSMTPFIPTRYPKSTRAGVPKRDARGLQIGSPEHELRRLLLLGGFPEPVAVEPVSFTEIGGRKASWSSFCRARSSGEGRRAGSTGFGFRIQFPEPVRGPVAVGYGAHFGMGGFGADETENDKEIHGF